MIGRYIIKPELKGRSVGWVRSKLRIFRMKKHDAVLNSEGSSRQIDSSGGGGSDQGTVICQRGQTDGRSMEQAIRIEVWGIGLPLFSHTHISERMCGVFGNFSVEGAVIILLGSQNVLKNLLL